MSTNKQAVKTAKTTSDPGGLTRESVMTKCKTKSAAIRYLASLDWPRGKIATFLDVKYQYVRTVLITPLASEIGRYHAPEAA
jgi:hypothetical protein